MGQRSATFDIQRIGDGERHADSDLIAVEEPLEIRLGYLRAGRLEEKNISVTMRTPGNDDELATGFLFSEGIVEARRAVQKVVHCGPRMPETELRNIIRVEVDETATPDLARLERHFYTTSSCGVCGKTSIEALKVQSRFQDRLRDSDFATELQCLLDLPAALEKKQQVFEQTGGLHAAALFDASGEVISVREDVGRHNALDKLIGRLFLDDQLPADGFGILVSGRTSFELVQKTVMAGCPVLAAVGAPSSLAIEMARDFGVTLVGFLRDGRANIYAGERRILG